MPPVSQRVPDLLGGVSQQAPHLRRPNELEESLNAYHSPSKGFGKRPNTSHVAKISSSPSSFTNAELQVLNHDGQKFYVAVLDQDIQVWNENGIAQTVKTPHGKTYLDISGPGSIRMATVGRRTFILNREKTVQIDGTSKSPASTSGAVVYVNQGDFSTIYSLTVSGRTVEYQTPAGLVPSDRRDIATTSVAKTLRDLLVLNLGDTFSVVQVGSMLHISRTDGGDFPISVEDGLAGNGLVLLKTTVQSVADLPLQCVGGFVVEVIGDPSDSKDNFWVRFEISDPVTLTGTWEECPRPGEAVSLDASTLPHELVYSDEVVPATTARALIPDAEIVFPIDSFEKIVETWQDPLNGSSYLSSKWVVLNDHQDDIFVNLEGAVGAPILFGIRYEVDTTKLLADETLKLTIALNDGTAGTTWTTHKTLTFPPGLLLKGQVTEVQIADATAKGVPVNYDVRVMVEYESGATPAAANVGTVLLEPNLNTGVWYYNLTAKDIVFPAGGLYPKGAVVEFILEPDGTFGGGDFPFSYTLTSDMTSEALATALAAAIDAVHSATVGTDVVTTSKGPAVRITKAGGSGPTPPLVSRKFDLFSSATIPIVTFDDNERFWNPDISFGFTGDALDGMTFKNLSDGSSGTITDCYDHGFTFGALSGGVTNKIKDGDLCAVIDPNGSQWTFRKVAWKGREAGDTITNPWPSVRGKKIRDVFFHRGRLGLLCENTIVFSEAAVLENLFRTVTVDLIDSDPIDVEWAGGEGRFHSAVLWNGEAVLMGDRVQVVPRGEPVFSPKSIRLDVLSDSPCDPRAKPEAADRFVFFGRRVKKDGVATSSQVQVLRISPRTRVAETLTATTHVPSYLAGAPIWFAADSAYRLVLVSTESDRKTLYHLTYSLEDDVAQAFSWGKWQFAGEVLAAKIIEGVVLCVLKYSDGIYLETLDLITGL
jgi:hypothetical protein